MKERQRLSREEVKVMLINFRYDRRQVAKFWERRGR